MTMNVHDTASSFHHEKYATRLRPSISFTTQQVVAFCADMFIGFHSLPAVGGESKWEEKLDI